MDRPRIALLNASFDDANTRRNFRRELDGSVEEFDVTEGHLPETYDHDAVVVTGSRASVYWDDPWIDAAREAVRRAVDRDLPVLGVCWGHQLLADALGGTVAAMEDREIGYREVSLTDAGRADPIFDGVESPLLVFTTHGDAVVELPPDATRLAANDYGLQAFRHGSAVGVQFHPEYDRETAEAVTRGKDMPQERIDRVVADITAANYRRASRAKTLFANFTDAIPTRAAD